MKIGQLINKNKINKLFYGQTRSTYFFVKQKTVKAFSNESDGVVKLAHVKTVNEQLSVVFSHKVPSVVSASWIGAETAQYKIHILLIDSAGFRENIRQIASNKTNKRKVFIRKSTRLRLVVCWCWCFTSRKSK